MAVIWKPQPKQIEFMKRGEYEVLYGGAAGGGKSDALLAEALRQIDKPKYKALILRKTYPQLRELIDRSLYLYPQIDKQAKYNDSKHVWVFGSGAKIYFGSMLHSKDKHNYQGQQYDFIGFDELTHFTFDEYTYLFSRNRPNAKGHRVYIRATTNPGGIGHGWVKERFITAAPPLQPIVERVTVNNPDGSTREIERKRVFVPSTVFDNQILLDNDPTYLGNLAMLPEAQKQALLYGDWDSFSGQVFTEWINDKLHYEDGLNTHVIEPFGVPGNWLIYRGFDMGYSKPFSVGWYAVDERGKIYRIRELYGCTGVYNEGVKWDIKQICNEIKQIEDTDPNIKGHKIIGVSDPAIFSTQTGESIAEMFEKNGVFFERGSNDRLAGKMQYHYRLAFDEKGEPMLQIFNTCKHFIRTIPNLIYSEKNVEDVDTTQEDHIYDECRYVLMCNPISSRKIEKKTQSDFDPLNQNKVLKNKNSLIYL